MEEVKPWYLSKTIWASMVAVLTALGGLFGLPLAGLDDNALVEAIVQIAAAIAGIVALFGRLSADEGSG